MKTQGRRETVAIQTGKEKGLRAYMLGLLLAGAFLLISISSFAHCDSYDGPVIKDALKALDQNKVELVLKWIEPQQEKEVISLFDKTYKLKKGDKEVYTIVEKHFLETLVRLHRETEGAPYTGLKPKGSMTPLVEMADNSIEIKDVEGVLETVKNHLDHLVKERFETVLELSKTKDNSVEQGRAYVEAYVIYTHTLEHLEHILHDADGGHAGH